MSAFMCDDVTFQVLVAGGFEYGLISTETEGQHVGQMLATENGWSMGYRYEGNSSLTSDETNPRFAGVVVTEGKLNPYALLKALNCWNYQSCEHPGWEDGTARAWGESLREAVLARHPDMAVMVPSREGKTHAYRQSDKYNSAPGWGHRDTFADFIES